MTVAALTLTLALAAAPAATATPTATTTPYEPFAALRQCESGSDYRINTGNGFYGAYQFTRGTWNAVAATVDPPLTGVRPDRATAVDQDRMAYALAYQVPWGGRGHWPVCGRFIPATPPSPPPSPSPSVDRPDPLPVSRQPTNSFGRRTDRHLTCDHDGDGIATRVAIRGNIWFVDAANDGIRHDIAPIGYGRATDTFDCRDTNSDGIDELVAERTEPGGHTITYTRAQWTTGNGEVRH